MKGGLFQVHEESFLDSSAVLRGPPAGIAFALPLSMEPC